MAQNQRQRLYPQTALNIRPRSCFRSGGRGRRGRRPLHGFLREPKEPSGTQAPASSPEVCRKGQKCQAQGETFRAATQGRPCDRSTKHGRRGASRCARKKTPVRPRGGFHCKSTLSGAFFHDPDSRRIRCGGVFIFLSVSPWPLR